MYSERSNSSRGEGDPEEEGEGRVRFAARRVRVCQFCIDQQKKIEYRNTDLLRSLVSDRGKIRPRRQTGTCARHQRLVAVAIKRARHMALLPYSGEY